MRIALHSSGRRGAQVGRKDPIRLAGNTTHDEPVDVFLGPNPAHGPGAGASRLMPRRVRGVRRTPTQVEWDVGSLKLAEELGRALKDARLAAKLTQAEVGTLAGVVQGTVSGLERGRTATLSFLVVARLAKACGAELHAYIKQASGAEEPRDMAHLRTQALIVETAAPGGWAATPEAAIDDAAERSRSIDVLLERVRARMATEVAIVEVFDWLPDVGAAFRSWDRRLARAERWAIATRAREWDGATLIPRVSGCWVLRATKRNRRLVRELRALFAVRFPGAGRDWLAAFGTDAPMPSAPALLWVSVKGDRLWPVRL